MNYIEWKAWYKALPFSKKWFVVLFLIYPILAALYFLKHISPVFSPLNILGIIMPLLMTLSIITHRIKLKVPDIIMFLIGLLVLYNSIFMVMNFINIDSLAMALKNINFVLLYFYLRTFIKSKKDFIGLMQTFMYASIIPLALVLYENVVSPIGDVAHVQASRGGGTRYNGPYADVVTYAIYFVGALTILTYFYLRNLYKESRYKIKTTQMYILLALIILGLISIKHTSSWGVVFAIFLFFMMNLRLKKSTVGFILVGLLILTVFGESIYMNQIDPLLAKEKMFFDGNMELKSTFNGRMSRWLYYLPIWLDMPMHNILFGVGSSGYKHTLIITGIGIHNDFLRILFFTGIVGLGLYIWFIIYFLFKSFKKSKADHFIIIIAVVSLALFSVTVIPTLYTMLIAIYFSIFVYSLTSTKKRLKK